MLRTLTIPVAFVFALAGVLSIASTVRAQGGSPDYLVCAVGEKNVLIPIIDGDVRTAVVECLAMGGHPAGVARDH